RSGSSIEQILHGTPLPQWFDPLSREELLILIGACYLHDIGMHMTSAMTPVLGGETFRGDSGYRSAYDELIRPAHPYIIHEMICSPMRPGDPARLGLARSPRDLQTQSRRSRYHTGAGAIWKICGGTEPAFAWICWE